MNLTEQERKYEENRLKYVIERIENALEKSVGTKEKYKNEVIITQKAMQNDVHFSPTDLDDLASVWQFQSEIDMIGQKFKFLDKQVKRLERLVNSTYFARIDFKEVDEEKYEQIYIGLSNFTDEETGEFLVYDWRAPISSMFYDYEVGDAKYICPVGIIEGNILLKRQYTIYKGKIERMFDCNLKIDDEILQEILNKSADDKMKTIINTIQREQNLVIRDDTHKLLLVQGPAGSGKTSIALHRIAYLLYRYRDSIKAENIVIFSPNLIFSDYISSVLPELGEENMVRMTFISYGQKVTGGSWQLEDMNELMEYILSSRGQPGYADRIINIKYKTSQGFVRVLKNYVEYLGDDGIKFKDIVHKNSVIISKEKISELFSKDYAYLPIIKRLMKLRQRLFFLIEPMEKKRIEEVRLKLADSGNYIDKGEIEARSTLIVREEFKNSKDNIINMTTLNLFETYLKLFKDIKLLKRLSDGDVPNYISTIKASTFKSFEQREIKYEDLAPIIYLKSAMGDLPDASSMKYVIIDEVQDYMPLQFEIFKILFNQSSMTLLGDLNQSINPFINSGDFEGISKIYGCENNSAYISLTKSYRSTKEITEFCQSILGTKGNFEYIDREGEKPIITGFNDFGTLQKSITSDIKKLKAKGHKSIAIICRTAKGSLNMYEGLQKSGTKVSLITAEDTEFVTGKAVIPSYLAKGLEFDAVLVVCTEDDGYEVEEERRLFYTVCTRALHVLNIYYTGKVPMFIR